MMAQRINEAVAKGDLLDEALGGHDEIEVMTMLASECERLAMGAIVQDPTGRTMFARLSDHPINGGVLNAVALGQLVCVEVPPTCTIHSADKELYKNMRALTQEVARLERQGVRPDDDLLGRIAGLWEGRDVDPE